MHIVHVNVIDCIINKAKFMSSRALSAFYLEIMLV